jgi:hypothetical protein
VNAAGSNQYRQRDKGTKQPAVPRIELAQQANAGDKTAEQARRAVWEEIAHGPNSRTVVVMDAIYRSASCPDDIKASVLLRSNIEDRRGIGLLVCWVLRLPAPGLAALTELAQRYPEHLGEIRQHPQWDRSAEPAVISAAVAPAAQQRLYMKWGKQIRGALQAEQFVRWPPRQRAAVLAYARIQDLHALTYKRADLEGNEKTPLLCNRLSRPETQLLWDRLLPPGSKTLRKLEPKAQDLLRLVLRQQTCPPEIMEQVMLYPPLQEFAATLPNCPRYLVAMWQLVNT